jgi:glycosyltransferase involved in cell wall biosynthesis
MAMDKLISVVIPTFDRKALTDRAIGSVTPSRPELFEIIVVDDCGTTPYAYHRSANPSGVPVRTFCTAANAGPGLARKLGVEKSKGYVIAFLDSDDTFEPAWPDAILTEVLRHDTSLRDGLFIAGNVYGGASLGLRWCFQLLCSVREPRKMLCVRLAAIAFNPFYTQATAISKDICSFSDSLRYCEDYFTHAMAIFRARKISVLPVTATRLSRPAGTPGGLTQFRRKMWRGEFDVRKSMLFSRSIPLPYRALVPLGMAYALARNTVKSLLGCARFLRSNLRLSDHRK